MSQTTTTKPSAVPFPGLRTTADGSQAVVWVETHTVSAAVSYPITPSTGMGVGFQENVANGAKNLWGETLLFFEPESEHSAASTCEGFALSGGRVSTYTSSQGLVLMKEVLYTIAGKRLPVVFHIGARAISYHALNVHAGHDDLMSVADCGWGILFARNAQEAADFALISRKTAERSRVPYFNAQDGFLTTHTVETAYLPEPELMKKFLGSPSENLVNLMDPKHPVMSGTVQNQDAYMRGKIAQREYYGQLKTNLLQTFAEYAALTGRKYDLIESYRMDDAEFALVGMGSYMETTKVAVDLLRQQGRKVGCVSVFSYCPFPAAELVTALKNCQAISVLERLDECHTPENPLARGLKAAFADALWGAPELPKVSSIPVIQHGAGGLGSRDVRLEDIVAIYDNMKLGRQGKVRYCIGIDHPDSLPTENFIVPVRGKNDYSLRGHSVGGFGSVSTNKLLASVADEVFGLNVQAYPKYGAEKKGLPTTFFLTFSDKPIWLHQELAEVDFVAVMDPFAFLNSQPTSGLVDGGTVFFQSKETDLKRIWMGIPKSTRDEIVRKKIRLYILDSQGIADKFASSADLRQRMMGITMLGVFLKVTPFVGNRGWKKEELMEKVEALVRKMFGKRDEKTVRDNLNCILAGYDGVREITPDLMTATTH
ncbi:MAG: 2-oxoacid:acceptor oxidoreductase family protein [Bdellovibrionales bacterium]|nr:2-oxoacid:acceptor oxidoreductase family protein [Bdellovibrionales bacterium]